MTRKGDYDIMDLDFELDDSREKEKDIMTLHVNDVTLEIPEELLEERMQLLHFDSKEDNIADLIKEHNTYLKCFIRNEKGFNNSYNEKFINHLQSELNIFR